MIRKRKLLILFVFILVIMLLSNIFAVNILTYKPKYGVTTANVYFRSSSVIIPGNVIKKVIKGTHLKMVGEYDNFYITQLPTNEIGLIAKNYIKSTSKISIGKVYTRYSPYSATVVSNYTNVRRGPSTSYTRVSSLRKNTIVTVIGKIDNFYAVIYNNNKVGFIEKNLISRKITSNSTPTPIPAPTIPKPLPDNTNTINLSNQDLIIQYINNERIKQGLNPLLKDSKLMDIAQRKSNEMVEKNYFLHTSPTYGTPFNMMKNFGITYKTAGENLAGNSTMKGAVDSWMNSEGHRKNILSNTYTNIGVGVTKNERYGYIISAMFIRKIVIILSINIHNNKF